MTAKHLSVAVLACALTGMVALASDDPSMGTWKLNEAKSKIGAGAAKNNTVVYTAAGDSVKVTVDGVDGTGKATHSEWTGKFDGKDYPVHSLWDALPVPSTPSTVTLTLSPAAV